jgi:coniferyl-aldehyde dehydrogenase
MKAASENLTPVTLELGGKCPVIVAEDSVNEATVSAVLAYKILKGGQVCIAPDYVFVPENKRDAFVSLCKEIMPGMLPSYTDHAQSTGIINERHLDRLLSYLEDAEVKGAELVQLYERDESVNREDRKPPFTLILDPDDGMKVMQEEIFGPILPVKTYASIDDAISYINDHERPLALYIYSNNKKQVKDVLKRTISGGACVNTMLVHAAIPSVPFGGVGYSGMGRYKGFEGFQTFSNQRTVFEMGERVLPADTFYPPYGETMEQLLEFVLMRDA